MPSVRNTHARQRPRAGKTGERAVQTPAQQRGDGEGEGHREADIAHVQQRRVENQPRVLQQRVQVAPSTGKAGSVRANGPEVNRMNARKPAQTIPITASTRATISAGTRRLNTATPGSSRSSAAPTAAASPRAPPRWRPPGTTPAAACSSCRRHRPR
ncbi:Uncharacterised protein [Salmonella enterica subsp. enterica]|nr:Uncharacterised protein [Salmonella enterica subsp. enterica]